MRLLLEGGKIKMNESDEKIQAITSIGTVWTMVQEKFYIGSGLNSLKMSNPNLITIPLILRGKWLIKACEKSVLNKLQNCFPL